MRAVGSLRWVCVKQLALCVPNAERSDHDTVFHLYIMILCTHYLSPTPSLTIPTSPGRPIYAELSPVTDFREACCRQNDLGECNRGGFCNFMHLREPPTSMLKELHHQQRVQRRLFPSERDIERKKEMEMFQMQYGGAASSSADDRDRRDRDRR